MKPNLPIKLVFAWTPPSGSYPPYINISKCADGNCTLTVRESKDNLVNLPPHTIKIDIDNSVLWKMVDEILKYLREEKIDKFHNISEAKNEIIS